MVIDGGVIAIRSPRAKFLTSHLTLRKGKGVRGGGERKGSCPIPLFSGRWHVVTTRGATDIQNLIDRLLGKNLAAFLCDRHSQIRNNERLVLGGGTIYIVGY
jgi:hypothetical protein